MARSRALRRAAAAACALAAVAALAICAPFDASRYLTPLGSSELVDRNGTPLYGYLNTDGAWCFPRELDEISPYLAQATIAVEDQRFYRHPGVDPIAVARAVWQNTRRGGVTSGASTLTMQVVKRGDRSTRSIAGKARQAVTALRLERNADKPSILAAYLNSVPYGLNLVGCEAAARRYFGKTSKELTLPEAAFAGRAPKAPSAYMPLTHPDAARPAGTTCCGACWRKVISRRTNVIARSRLRWVRRGTTFRRWRRISPSACETTRMGVSPDHAGCLYPGARGDSGRRACAPVRG